MTIEVTDRGTKKQIKISELFELINKTIERKGKR